MKRPSFQFYPADWRNNAKLRRCAWAARGAWIETMGLFHDSDEYGILRWPLKEIAQALGCPIACLRELAEKGVLKGADNGLVPKFTYTPSSGRKAGPTVTLIEECNGPIWYCSRMVRDEYVRQKKANFELYKDAPNYPSNQSPMGGIGEGLDAPPMPPKSELPTSTSSSSIKTKNLKPLSGSPDVLPAGFTEFWATWPKSPRKDDKAECLKRWKAKGMEAEAAAIVAAVVAKKSTKKWLDGFEPAPLTFLNKRQWLDDVADQMVGGAAGSGAVQSDPDAWRQDPRFKGLS